MNKIQNLNIAIFENEFNLIEDDFRIANYAFFDDGLKYSVFESSQSFGNYDQIHDYDMCFVDVDLSKKSEADGIAVIAKLLEKGYEPDRIIILTGHSTIESKLKEREVPELQILKKPIDIDDLQASISKTSKAIKNL